MKDGAPTGVYLCTIQSTTTSLTIERRCETMAQVHPLITFVSTLDWPDDFDNDDVATTTTTTSTSVVQCAGRGYLAYESRLLGKRDFLFNSTCTSTTNGGRGGDPSSSSVDNDSDEEGNGSSSSNKKTTTTKKEYDLLTLSDRKLKKLSYYHVLSRSLPMHATTDEIRRAYHRACLRYHPDKTGRDEEDEVFLLVKSAFDTLSDPMKRRSYDSTVDFDESIPRAVETTYYASDDEFYKEYGPVFERNLRFAACNDPMNQLLSPGGAGGNDGGGAKKGKNNNNNNKKKGNGSSSSSSNGSSGPPPSFGDDTTPLDQVHKFYDFWIHFESWRDFTLRASTETEHDVDAADSRDEKRWMKQEIERKVKKMKKDEMARINLLVERAMSVDPRLRREKERIARERKEKEDSKKRVELEKIIKENVEKELREREAASKRADEEMKKKESKKIKDAEKKQIRKARQLFRKLTMAAYQSSSPGGSETGNDSVWDDLETMNDDIELLCDKLSILELTSLTDLLGGMEAVEEESNISVNVSALVDVQQCARETAAGAERQSLITIQRRNEARKADEEKARIDKAARATSPWSKDELGALAKGVKKYPPGGSNRWDAIALYVNNLCKLPDPRTKEECIEKYNSIAASSAVPPSSTSSSTLVTTDVGETIESSGGPWTEEQDALLQEMLRKYPADMEKNERWKMIAKGVPDMTKKDCVERYKAIRDAVQKKGKN